MSESIIPSHLRITKIEQTVIVTTTEEEDDQRYRILVNLHRSDRPKYWTYSCPFCKADVIELNNYEVVSESDVFDARLSLVGRRCPGKFCRRYYYFNLS
jgi:hypothetical protein